MEDMEDIEQMEDMKDIMDMDDMKDMGDMGDMNIGHMGDMKDMNSLRRCLVGRERVQVNSERQDRCSVIDVWADTDYAGCLETRKSTSGGLVLIGRHMIKWLAKHPVGHCIVIRGRLGFYGVGQGHP